MTIDANTKVKVYNNVFNEVIFETVNGRVVRLPRNGAFKDIFIEDLDYIMATAPAMVTEGILYIEDDKIREYLDVKTLYTNKNIIPSKDFAKILKQKPEQMKKSLKKVSKTAKKEIANMAKEKSKELTGGQKEAIEAETKVEIEEKY